MSVNIRGGADTAGLANVDADFNLNVALPFTEPDGTLRGGGNQNAGAVAMYSENDRGSETNSMYLLSPETDSDFRLRTANELPLDDEVFDYTAQNTGKHSALTTTFSFGFTTGGLLSNSSSTNASGSGSSIATYGFFPVQGMGQATFIQFAASFSTQPIANTIVDVGLYLRNVANPYAPSDGVYFRLNSGGLQGVINANGAETSTSPFTFSYANNQTLKFLIAIYRDRTEFWIDDVLMAAIETPVGQGQPCVAAALPFAFRHSIVGGTAGGVFQVLLKNYSVSAGGVSFSRTLNEFGNASYGSYQGLSGGTMGSVQNYANSANPVAAVPANTSANLGTGLGGQFWETDTLAVNTDGIICSFQVPAGTVSLAGRRVRINGVTIDSYIQTALTGGGYNAQWSLAFGHTAVSLATGEAASTKAPRRVAIGSNSVASGATALTQLQRVSISLQNPIYVNPGEFIAVVKKKVGTAPSAGTVAHMITIDFSYE
jgi:hypothetical protein